MSRDVNPQSKKQFASSGLIGPKGDWIPNASWYYLGTFKYTFRGMIFNCQVENDDKEVEIYSFKEKTGSKKGAYVIWLNTSEDKQIDNFEFALNPALKQLTMINLRKGKPEGEIHSVISKKKGYY